MPTLRLACLLFTTLCLPAHATTALVMAMPGFAWEGKGWVYELLSGMQANGQPLTLHLLPPARAVARFYRDGDGDLFAAALLCRRNDTHYLTLGVRDFEVFMTRTGNQVPGPSNPPAKNETILVVRGFNHPFVRQHPELGWTEVSSIEKGLDMLRAGRANYFFGFLALSEDIMQKQGSRQHFAYDRGKAAGEAWPALSFHQEEAGWQLAQQLRQQLVQQWQRGKYANLLQRHNLPGWYMEPGLQGQFRVVRGEDCLAMANKTAPAGSVADKLRPQP